MSNKRRYVEVAGRVVVGTVGIVLLLAGVLKLVDVGAEDMVEGLAKANLLQHKTLISVTAIVCGGLLLLPRIWPVGVLMATAYWGGAIVAHLTYNDSVIMPAAFLALLWFGSGACILASSENVQLLKRKGE